MFSVFSPLILCSLRAGTAGCGTQRRAGCQCTAAPTRLRKTLRGRRFIDTQSYAEPHAQSVGRRWRRGVGTNIPVWILDWKEVAGERARVSHSPTLRELKSEH